MELQAINFRPLVDSHSELAPYLEGLNVSEALEDFGRLADLVLSPKGFADQRQQRPLTVAALDDQHHQQAHQPLMVTPGYSNSVYSYLSESTSPGSPGGASLYSTTTTSSSLSSPWSQASSPIESDHSLSSPSSAFSSPCRHYSSSSASSVCGDLDDHHSSQRRSSRAGRPRSSGETGGNRRHQNATAAERYRRKLRGRQCGLDEELERERERNSKLMKSFEAKLELYREFADLLAANTRDPSYDMDLAELGSRSLQNIIEHICPAEFLAQNDRQRVELERLHEYFRRVLSVAQYRHQA